MTGTDNSGQPATRIEVIAEEITFLRNIEWARGDEMKTQIQELQGQQTGSRRRASTMRYLKTAQGWLEAFQRLDLDLVETMEGTGNLHRQGRDAEKAFERVLAIAREIRAAATEHSAEWTASRRGQGSALGHLRVAYAFFGQLQRAIKYTEAALRIFEDIKATLTPPTRAHPLHDLSRIATVFLSLGALVPHFTQDLRCATRISAALRPLILRGPVATPAPASTCVLSESCPLSL